MTPGTVVRMSASLRRALRANGSREHVSEFGGCSGIVVGPAYFGNGVYGPEVDVYWIPSLLKYAYSPSELSPSRKKVRGWRNKQKVAEFRKARVRAAGEGRDRAP